MGVTLVLLLCLSLTGLSQQTVDLNLRQLQFVSDHLTHKECGQLIAALDEKKFQVDGRKLKPVQDGEPCLMHLVDWNQGSAKNGTVEDLTLPLHQIGRADIARVLAKAVHDETTHELHKYFLDDPFKKTAHHKDSSFLVDDDEEKELKSVSARPAKWRPFSLAVFGLTMTLVTSVFFVCAMYCRTACATLCPKCVVIR